MYYSKLIVGGQEYRLAVNIVGYGPPAVVGDLGMLYVDLDSETIYKCFGGTDWRVAIHTPNITIEGENWHVDGVDTGVAARGEQGERGLPGSLGLHIGPDAPTDGQVAWIDTDETGADFPAKVGQVVAVKSVGADGKPAEYEGKDLPTVPTPNWAANPGTPGHIENRTHYVDEKGIVHKLDNKYIDAEWMATSDGGGGTEWVESCNFTNGWFFLKTENYFFPEIGFEYDVYWNGKKYTCPLVVIGPETGIREAFLGNLGMSSALDYPDTGEPFLFSGLAKANESDPKMTAIQKNTSTAETVEVTITTHERFNKMPEDYLPDCVVKSVNGNAPDKHGNVQIETGGGSASIDVTATVGQTIIVKEVDENGKPTKWESADYQHRICGEEEEVFLENTDLEFVFNEEVGGYIAMIPFSGNFAKGAVYTVTFNGVTYENTVDEETGGIGNVGLITGGEDTGEPYVIQSGATGEDGSINLLVFCFAEISTATLSIVTDGIKTIDEKYLPEIPFLDISNLGSLSNLSTGNIPEGFSDFWEKVYERGTGRIRAQVPIKYDSGAVYTENIEVPVKAVINKTLKRMEFTFLSGSGFFMMVGWLRETDNGFLADVRYIGTTNLIS